MKSIMISIKPKYVAKILNGEKTIEIRRTMPKCELPIDVYIYCTKEKPYLANATELFTGKYACINNNEVSYKEHNLNGKVVAKFTLNKVEEIFWRFICGEWENYTKTLGCSEISQASCVETREIAHYLKGNIGYAWHISNLVIFDRPKELSEFRCRKQFMPNGYMIDPLTKAPQSFMYVEELL